MSTRTKLFAAAASLGVLVVALSGGEEPSERQRVLPDDVEPPLLVSLRRNGP